MTGQASSLSFEIFPPKSEVGNTKILRALQEMQDLAPHFISVTCSNGSLNVEESTVRLADYIHNQLQIPSIAHLPAAYLTRDKVRYILKALDDIGV